MSDKIIYKIISDELASDKSDPAIWTQAIAISEGDTEKTKAAYIRLRYRELLQTQSHGAHQAPDHSPASGKPAQDKLELVKLRSELKRKLSITNKSSLYVTLGLDADVSDSTIATTISERESDSHISSATSVSEFNYAKKVLGDPALREQYDRKLINIVNDEISRRNLHADYNESSEASSWISSHKGSMVLVVLSITLLGYLGLDYFKARNSYAIEKEVVDIHRDVADSVTETDRVETYANIDYKKTAAEIALERQRQEFELRARALDQQRYDQERRYESEQERLRLQREQAEERKLQQQQRTEEMNIQKEKRYWTCVNQQLSMPNVTTHTAYSRCGAYR